MQDFLAPQPNMFPISEWKIPSAGVWKICLHDWENPIWKYAPRSLFNNGGNLPYRKDPPENALPETVPMDGLKPNDFQPLSKAWQRRWFEMLAYAVNATVTWGVDGWPTAHGGDMDTEHLIVAWLSLTAEARALTDRHAWNTPDKRFAEHVTGQNLDSPNGDMQIKSLQMGGNPVKVLWEDGTYYYIETCNLELPPPSLEYIMSRPNLHGFATQETIIKNSDGTYKVVHFPQLRINGVKTGTPFPIIGKNGVNRIEKKVVKDIANGENYSIVNLYH